MRGQSPSELYVSLACSTLSKVRSCFYPWERFTMERPKHYSIGEVQSDLLSLLAQTGGIGNRDRTFVALRPPSVHPHA